MCGIAGVVGRRRINQELYDALTVLQHRGQDAAGIMTFDDDNLFLHKDNGLVRDVFDQDDMEGLVGQMGIGHVRYPTAGCSSSAEAQPFYVNSPYGISLSHNGNLTNTEALRKEIWDAERRHVNTNSDSEILLNIFASALGRFGGLTLQQDAIFEAVAEVHKRCKGAYACVAMINGFGIVAFRDPFGIRPVVYGRRDTPEGVEYMIASESVALDALGFKLVGDIEPGEAICITRDGQISRRQCAEDARLTPCLFEHVYLARPDSIIDNIYVYKARLRMGDHLAQKIKRTWPDHDIDVVIPVPDTSRTSAVQLASELGVKYREGFIKNRYIGRTFIMPGQEQRKKSVRQKLNPIDLEFQGKNVLLVDDSIVRGTTSKQIIQMARDSGAKKVYFASAAPPVRYPNVYGIDMPTATELVAHGREEDEIATILGADRLIYQDLDALVDAVQAGNPDVQEFEDSVFSGNYVTKDVDDKYLNQLELFRSDSAKQARETVGRHKDVNIHNPV